MASYGFVIFEMKIVKTNLGGNDAGVPWSKLAGGVVSPSRGLTVTVHEGFSHQEGLEVVVDRKLGGYVVVPSIRSEAIRSKTIRGDAVRGTEHGW